MKKLDLLNTNIRRFEISSFLEEIEDLDHELQLTLWSTVYDAIRTDRQIELWGFISLGLRDALQTAS